MSVATPGSDQLLCNAESAATGLLELDGADGEADGELMPVVLLVTLEPSFSWHYFSINSVLFSDFYSAKEPRPPRA